MAPPKAKLMGAIVIIAGILMRSNGYTALAIVNQKGPCSPGACSQYNVDSSYFVRARHSILKQGKQCLRANSGLINILESNIRKPLICHQIFQKQVRQLSSFPD